MTTSNDAKVLNAILNPNTPFEEQTAPEVTLTKYDEGSAKISQAKDLEVKAQLSAEDLAEKQRKAKKDLANKIQALKKSVTKGDKKKKKEVDAQIEAMEREFAEKCKFEQAELESMATTTTKQSEQVESAESMPVKEAVKESGQKLSKAQKRREKKEKDDQERERLIAQQEIENLKGPTHIELTRIKEKLKAMGLEIKDVCADGNCMFYAVSDQLKQRLDIEKPFKTLRMMTSEYMLNNADEFQPYMCSEETGDPYSPEQYREYCEKIKDCVAPVWGSMTELKALADLLKVQIEVVQAEGSEILIGDSERSIGKLVVTFHRRMFGSGEHYNSTCVVKKAEEF